MQVFRSREKVGDLTKLNITSVELAASTLTIGGRQYTTGILTCDLSTSGVGGLDTGVVAANSVYYVYAVSQTSLIASLSIVNPVGYAGAKYVGAIQTDNAAEIIMVSQSEDFDTAYSPYTPTFSGFGVPPTIDFKSKRLRDCVLIIGTFISGTQTSEEYKIGLPSNSIIDQNSNDSVPRGFISWNAAKGSAVFNTGGDSGNGYFNLYTHNDATAYEKIITSSPLPVTGTTYYVSCTIPVEGWSEKISRTVEGR